MHVLLVHNDPKPAEMARIRMGFEGITADVAVGIDEAMSYVAHSDYDVVVVRLDDAELRTEMIQGRIGAYSDAPPVLAVVAASYVPNCSATGRVQALLENFADVIDDGAPPPEFLATIRKLALRRAALAPPDATFGRFRINFIERRCFIDGTELAMAMQSYDLLEYLVLRRDRVVPSDRILDRLEAVRAHVQPDAPVDHATIQMLARRVRENILKPHGAKDIIRVHAGAGLLFDVAQCSKRDGEPETRVA